MYPSSSWLISSPDTLYSNLSFITSPFLKMKILAIFHSYDFTMQNYWKKLVQKLCLFVCSLYKHYFYLCLFFSYFLLHHSLIIMIKNMALLVPLVKKKKPTINSFSIVILQQVFNLVIRAMYKPDIRTGNRCRQWNNTFNTVRGRMMSACPSTEEKHFGC